MLGLVGDLYSYFQAFPSFPDFTYNYDYKQRSITQCAWTMVCIC